MVNLLILPLNNLLQRMGGLSPYRGPLEIASTANTSYRCCNWSLTRSQLKFGTTIAKFSCHVNLKKKFFTIFFFFFFLFKAQLDKP